MSVVFEYLGSSGFTRDIHTSEEDIDFDPFFVSSQRRMRKAFGEGWVYGVDKNDDIDGYLIFRKKMESHVHEFKCYCGEKLKGGEK